MKQRSKLKLITVWLDPATKNYQLIEMTVSAIPCSLFLLSFYYFSDLLLLFIDMYIYINVFVSFSGVNPNVVMLDHQNPFNM